MSGPRPELQRMFEADSDERLDRVAELLMLIERDEAPADAIDVVFREAHNIKGMAGMMGVGEAAEVAHVVEDTLAAARESGRLGAEVVPALLAAVDAIRSAVHGTQGVATPAVEALTRELSVLSPAPPAEGAASEPGPAPEPSLSLAPPEPAPEPAAKAAPHGRSAAAEHSIRVDAGRVDAILDGVGEALLHQQRVGHLLRDGGGADDGDTEDLLYRSDLLLGELQEAVIHLRMLPVSSITSPYQRVVRDLAVAHGKQAELLLEGVEVQLDRVVLDGASEVISHLLRNAVAHGIEPPDDRAQAGKPATGRIVLRAQQRGERVVIEVADDGRGVPPALLERSLATGSLADVLSEPGTSTAGEVTSLAGRGVGLDAVRHHVGRLGGEFEVTSDAGGGTVARLLLPMSVARLRVLLVERAGVVVGVPLAAVREVTRSAASVTLGGRTGVRVDEAVVPLGDLVEALGGAPQPAADADGPVLMVGAGHRSAAVRCDRVVGEEHVVVKPLGPLLESLSPYLGAALLGDGRIALVAEPAHLVAAIENVGGSSPEPGQDPRPRTVLVVDDQFTVREMQRSILEAAGYHVETARDGREAWERLSTQADPDVVITDLEMPEMDGLELVAAIRRRSEGAMLPVIVVTSAARPGDEERGLQAGADAYIVKQRFDQRTLLDTVSRLAAV